MQMMGGTASKLRVHTDSIRIRECQQRLASSKELPPHCHDYVKAKPVAVVLGSRRTEFFTDV